jgi:hypothetical protein
MQWDEQNKISLAYILKNFEMNLIYSIFIYVYTYYRIKSYEHVT